MSLAGVKEGDTIIVVGGRQSGPAVVRSVGHVWVHVDGKLPSWRRFDIATGEQGGAINGAVPYAITVEQFQRQELVRSMRAKLAEWNVGPVNATTRTEFWNDPEILAAMIAALRPVLLPLQGDCPDGGTCHHDCESNSCFRVRCCGPLSGVFSNDEWPDEMRAAHMGRRAS